VVVVSIVAIHGTNTQGGTAPMPDANVSVVMRCQDCGSIESIREIHDGRTLSTAGAASASPVGLVMYIPLGRKTETDKAYVGSAGSREWQERTANTRYEFSVRMDNGSYRLIPRQGVSDFVVGDRVKVSQTQFEHTTQ